MKLSLLAVLALILVGCNKGSAPEPKSEEEKTFYAVGGLFGAKLKDLNLTEQEVAQIVSGVKDGALNAKMKVDPAQYGTKVQELFRKRFSQRTDGEKKKGAEYLETYLKDGSAKKTESGLAYKIIEEGTGKTPKETDKVKVHYEGKLIDGTVFDSSIERKKPVSFPLNRVIKGWTEGLQLVKTGGKIQLVIPSDLAYGDHGAAPKIPGGATLIFDVELIEIEKAAPAKKGKKK